METEVTFNAEKERYEIRADDELVGFTQAQARDGVMLMPHTKIFEGNEGKGLAGTLVAGALDDIRSRGLKVRASCEYVANYIDKHADYHDLVAD